jgi:hypothetical protein
MNCIYRRVEGALVYRAARECIYGWVGEEEILYIDRS